MTYEFEQIGELTREYTVPITREALNERISTMTSEVATNARVKGFRAGKTPRSVISQRYGPAIEQEVLQKIVNEECSSILEDEALKASWIGRPFLVDSEEDFAHTFRVRVECAPTLEFDDFSELQVKKPVVQISDEHIVTLILEGRRACIDWFDLEGDNIGAKDGDRVWLERTDNASEESDALGGQQPVDIRDPSNDTEKDLHEKIRGKKLEDEITLNTAEAQIFLKNDDFSESELSVTVKRIQIGDLPQLNENLFSDYRFMSATNVYTRVSSSEELHAAIRNSNEEFIESSTKQIFFERIRMALAKKHISSLPRETLRENYSRKIVRNNQDQQQATFYTFQLFDMVVDGTPLDAIFNADEGEQDQNGEINEPEVEADADESGEGSTDASELQVENRQAALTYMEEYAKSHVKQAVREVAYSFVQGALVEQRNIEADQEWIAARIQESVNSLGSGLDNERMQQQLDYLYSEEHYRQLMMQSIDTQVSELLADEVTIEEETVDFNDFRTQFEAEFEQDLLEAFEIEPIYPMPDAEGNEESSPDIASDQAEESESVADDAAPVEEDGEAEEDLTEETFSAEVKADEANSAPSDEVTTVEPEKTAETSDNKPRFLRKLFGKQKPPKE